MSYWAELNENNIVTNITVGDDNDSNGDKGYQWLIDNIGGTWVEVEPNNIDNAPSAGIGYSYDSSADVFISPQPYPSWTLDQNFDWQPPTPKPEDGTYIWNESTISWDLVE